MKKNAGNWRNAHSIPVPDSSNSQRAAVRKWEQKCDMKDAVCSYRSARCALILILGHVGAMIVLKYVVQA